MIQHHPSDATLLAYAAGRLPRAHRIVLRAHLAVCETCRHSLALAEEVGAATMAALPPAPLGPNALHATLARLGPQAPRRAHPPAPSTVADFARGRWWWLGPGIRLMPLLPRGADDTRLDLIRVAPGTALPGHGHSGNELACVLQGAFGDSTGTYAAGDIAEGDVGLEHEPVAMPVDQECICLIATTGRLRAHGWVARMVQPLFGI
jgi:putative transcriptional regulator